MALIQVLHPHVILFLLFIGFIYFGMFFLSDVSTKHTFPSTVLVTKKLLMKLVISYHCVALVLRFEVDDFIYNSIINFDKKRVLGIYYFLSAPGGFAHFLSLRLSCATTSPSLCCTSSPVIFWCLIYDWVAFHVQRQGAWAPPLPGSRLPQVLSLPH